MVPKKTIRYRSRSRQKGAEIVEFIVTLPVVLIVAAIMIDLGALFSDRIILTNAVRAAAREAVKGSPPAQVQQVSNQITQSLVSADPLNLPAVTVACSSSPCDPGNLVSVTLTHPYTFLLLPAFVSSAANINLTAKVQMNMLPTL